MSNLSFLGFNFKRGTQRNLTNSSMSQISRFGTGGVTKGKGTQKSNVGRVFLPSVKEEEEMRIVFDKFDRNRDGKISEEEYKSAVGFITTKAESGKEFKAADRNGDGFIDLEEFVKVQNTERRVGGDNDDIKSAFKVFDVDGNGKISPEELLEVLGRLGERSSLEACTKMVRGFDADGDGLINMDEFMIMMTRTTKY